MPVEEVYFYIPVGSGSLPFLCCLWHLHEEKDEEKEKKTFWQFVYKPIFKSFFFFFLVREHILCCA